MPSLETWDKLKDRAGWESLLVGNGLSRAVWEGFSYESLFDAARSSDASHQLDKTDVLVFDQMGTRNFEWVLHQLLTAMNVGRSFGHDVSEYETHYERIRLALIGAVHDRHVPWADVADESTGESVLTKIKDALTAYRYVFSTNYDILVYWAAMYGGTPDDFVDYFWNSSEQSIQFAIDNTDIWDADATVLAYPHGALHLVHDTDNAVHKLCNMELQAILDQFGEPLVRGASPLTITEGTSESKMKSIRSADYLSFVFGQLAALTKPMVIFGHTLLDSADGHLVHAIRGYHGVSRKGRAIVDRNRRNRAIAISIWPGVESIDAEMSRYESLFPEADLVFFDSETHPLGGPDLRIS
ncbi:MAG: DUF4917 family protein [Chloroflexi bacterium]|nr:DUF4917 family protein [Chloroflexota bacterium]